MFSRGVVTMSLIPKALTRAEKPLSGSRRKVSLLLMYVRQGRFTKGQLDKAGEFTISVPLENPDPQINKICGWQSGFNIDKVKEAGLELVDADTINTPGVKQYPLTIECKVLYAQDQDLSKIPEDIREKTYPQDVDGTY